MVICIHKFKHEQKDSLRIMKERKKFLKLVFSEIHDYLCVKVKFFYKFYSRNKIFFSCGKVSFYGRLFFFHFVVLIEIQGDINVLQKKKLTKEEYINVKIDEVNHDEEDGIHPC